MLKLLIAATVLPVAAVAIPAAAQTSRASIHVTYADLDLATPAGTAKLDRRIAGAAAKFCSEFDDHDLLRRATAQRCRRRLIASVTAQRAQAIAAAGPRRDVAALVPRSIDKQD